MPSANYSLDGSVGASIMEGGEQLKVMEALTEL